MGLPNLPIEIISMISEHLSVDQVFNLSLTCQYLYHTLQSESICRLALQGAKFSQEAMEAERSTRCYAHALRRLVKRREAVRSGRPYLVARVAWAEYFTYTNGFLCYTLRPNTLRILDIHGSAEELAVRASTWLPSRIHGFHHSLAYHVRPLHYASDLLSCMLVQNAPNGGTNHWLLVLDMRETQLLVCHRLAETEKLFVRNNRSYLFYGTYHPVANQGVGHWHLTQFNLRSRKSKPTLIVWDLDGTDIGIDVCFEIFDDRFYCLSSKARPFGPDIPWNSYYNMIRFPLHRPDPKYFEHPHTFNMWRRHSAEGPCDLRWSSLQLVRDEASGRLVIYESRRECLRGNAQSQRTCYRKEVSFEPRDLSSSDFPPDILDHEDYDGGDGDDADDDDTREEEMEAYMSVYTETRRSEDVHVGDNGTRGTMFPINECFLRSYNPSCRTFVDFTSNPPLATAEDQQLRLRVRAKPDAEETTDTSARRLETSDKSDDIGGVDVWPREDQPKSMQNIIRDLLSYKPLVTELDWAMDERSLVYAAGGQGSLRPIVLISFDPRIHLPSASQQSAHEIIHSTQRAVLQDVNSQGM